MRRFYKSPEVGAQAGGWQVSLDGRALKTQAGRSQIVPTRALAEAIAAEWDAQGEELDPATFPMRDMVDYAIDQVAPDMDAAVVAVLPYGDTDTLCYRAADGESFRARQDEAWEPILSATEAREGVRFVRASGVLHAPQPVATRERLNARLATFDPFTLVAVHNMAAINASLCIALAALEDDVDLDALFGAANLEEDWQAIQWGWDGDALARRDSRLAGFKLAAELARLVRQPD
ncbi:molecular chaperone [Croceicoccus ponticola]|uniref:Molecular chaperone n=1 Tax=Croceicoccus ponticola TaxID=2217664 RepID=A0A437GWJ7_9SPHN|nr:ATP12 family protein [Croceicoccus ponticola]RVQ66482.1 molecular chaperone [Croceicoccus ponticola]